jgi:predicted metal-dependent phosphoesterase TrpH
MIDLHSHTTASDGEHPATELVRRAHAAGVTTLAVTDHDTVAGLSEAEVAAKRLGMRLVPGIELTAFLGENEIHLLGHFIDASDANLATVGERLRKGRRTRMEKMLERLRAAGIAIEMSDVQAVAGSENLRRPHLARVLVNRGAAADISDAFAKYLGRGQVGFVEHPMLGVDEAIALVRGAHGVATVAHPGVSRLDRSLVREMKANGLGGLEVFHSDHGSPARELWLDVARELDLVATAGSDFHGESVAPGRRLGGVGMDATEFSRLEARRV